MIPAWVLAGLFLITAATVLYTSRYDFAWIRPARLFLAASLASWAGFYYLADAPNPDITVLRPLSRWLHLPLVISILTMSIARVYSAHKGRDNE